MKRINEIKEILPHRYPFLLVDRIVTVDVEGKRIECLKNVSVNEPFFEGHFPAHPIMPGVLIIEALAQAAGVLSGSLTGTREDTLYLFAGADRVRFKTPVVPGDQLVLRAELMAVKCNIWKFACEALVDGGIVCTAEITCARKELSS